MWFQTGRMSWTEFTGISSCRCPESIRSSIGDSSWTSKRQNFNLNKIFQLRRSQIRPQKPGERHRVRHWLRRFIALRAEPAASASDPNGPSSLPLPDRWQNSVPTAEGPAVARHDRLDRVFDPCWRRRDQQLRLSSMVDSFTSAGQGFLLVAEPLFVHWRHLQPLQSFVRHESTGEDVLGAKPRTLPCGRFGTSWDHRHRRQEGWRNQTQPEDLHRREFAFEWIQQHLRQVGCHFRWSRTRRERRTTCLRNVRESV